MPRNDVRSVDNPSQIVWDDDDNDNGDDETMRVMILVPIPKRPRGSNAMGGHLGTL
jgi:hypothetical protein